MKHLLAVACLASLTWAAHADENLSTGGTVPAETIATPGMALTGAAESGAASAAVASPPSGYAFEQPELLVDQLLWGIAHGARLLALACDRAGQGAAAESWVDWQERERPHILAAGRQLSRHYFNREDAPADAISAVLGLKPALALAPEQLAPACASFADALARPRYDLSRRREEMLKNAQEATGQKQ